tara:strand:- start:786 stop:956 length:171 start_codon:yes stop_codon:yes gene_type:complete
MSNIPFGIDTASQRRLIHNAESNRLRATRLMAVRLILLFGTISAICSALITYLLTR